MKPIQFAIVGTGFITHRFIKGVNKVDHVCVCAVVSRDMKKAVTYASAYENMKPYDDYEKMLQDDEIDAVYIATPNHTHFSYIMTALAHHKHVLCEKPMMLHKEEVTKAFAYAKQQGCMLMEAMKPCFLPTSLQAKRWIEEGRIGELRLIEAGYCSPGIDPFLDGSRAKLALGGGALYDIGVYPLGFANHIHPCEIIDVQAQMRILKSGVDGATVFQLKYKDGVLAQLRCAVDTPMENKAILYGSKGTITIPDFWKSEYAYLKSDKEETFYEPHYQCEFQYQIRQFVRDILEHKAEDKWMSEQASYKNAKVVDDIVSMMKGVSYE